MQTKNLLLIFGIMVFLAIFTTINVSASLNNLGTFKQGNSVQLIQNCNCTFNNITSIVYPNSTILITNIPMLTNDNINYYYFFNDTALVGTYTINGIGNDAASSNWQYQFQITPNGDTINTSTSILYTIVFVICFAIFIGLLYFGIKTDGHNRRDETTGYIIALNNLKYFKVICFGLAYIFGVFLSYFAWMISYAYLNFGFVSSILQFVFYFLAIATIPLLALFVYILIANAVRDGKIGEQLTRGLSIE